MKAITNGMIIGSGLYLLYEMFISHIFPIVAAGFFIGSIILNRIVDTWKG